MHSSHDNPVQVSPDTSGNKHFTPKPSFDKLTPTQQEVRSANPLSSYKEINKLRINICGIKLSTLPTPSITPLTIIFLTNFVTLPFKNSNAPTENFSV